MHQQNRTETLYMWSSDFQQRHQINLMQEGHCFQQMMLEQLNIYMQKQNKITKPFNTYFTL